MAVALVGVLGWTGAAALTIGSAVYLRREYKKQKAEAERKARESVQSRTSMELNIRQDPADARRFGYGTARYGGTMLFAHVATNNLYLISAVASFCKFSFIDYIIVGEDFIPWDDFEYSTTRTEFFTVEATSEFAKYREKLFIAPARLYAPTTSYSGTGINELDSWIINTHSQNMFSGGNWTFDKIQYVQIDLVYDNDVFPHGMPQISFILQRQNDAGFSLKNPALCIQDYLLNPYYGLGLSASDLDSTSFTAAATACNVAVTGGVRFETHIVFSTDEKPVDILNKLLDTCNGSLTFSNGKWHLNVGVWRTPVLDLDESDMRSELTVTARRGRAEIFNQVTGLITGEDGQPKDVPVYNNTGYQTEDGEEINTDITLDGVRAIHQATRIFRQRLEQNRHEITCSGVFGPRAVNLIPGENIRLSYTRYGWVNKYFEVVDYQRLQATDGVFDVKLILQETDPTIFDEADTPPEYAALETNLPDGRTVTAPSNLTITEELRLVGDVVEAWVVANWTASTDIFIRGYDFRFILTGETEYIDYGRVFGNNIDFVMPYIGEFTFEVRAVNTMGVGSEWITVTQEILGKTAPPSDVTGLSGQLVSGGYLLRWNPVPDLDLFGYSIRQGWTYPPDGPYFYTWAKSNEFLSPYLILPDGVDEVGLLWTVWAYDTSNTFSVHPAAHEFTVRRPEPPQNFTCQAVGSKVVMNWDEPAATYPISKYRVFRKKSSGEYVRLAEVNASYFIQEEFAAGQYIYAVMAYDAAGNASAMTEIESAITVLAPKGFIDKFSLERPLWGIGSDWADGIRENQTLPGGLTSCDYSPAELGLPPLENPEDRYLIPGIRPKNETVDEWIADTGYQSAQEAIDDGCILAIQPMSNETYRIIFGWGSNDPSKWIEIGHNIRFGAVQIELVETQRTGGDAIIESPRHFTRLQDGGGLQYFNTHNFYASNFGTTGPGFLYKASKHSIVIWSRLKMNLAIALEDYGGVSEAFAADVNGTFIPFPKEMNAIESLTATLKAPTSAANIIIEPQSANPITGMFVFAFNAAGDRVDCQFYWTMRGY